MTITRINTRVKGNAESSYRMGDVNITPENIGAMIEKPVCIELMPPRNNAGYGGYIDFHFNQSTADFTSRIIENGSGAIHVLATNGFVVNGMNIAKNFPRFYTFEAPSSTCWIKLGTLQTINADSTFFQVFTGNGNNARVDQNTRLDMFVKDGWQSSGAAANSYAAQVYVYNNATNVNVKLIANGTGGDKVDVWFYAPWGYASGFYLMYGEYVSWTHAGTNQTSEPGGTAQPVNIVRY